MSSLVTVFVPPGMEGTVFEEVATINGNRIPKRYQPWAHNGWTVVGLPYGLFRGMLKGDHGLDWSNANPEVMRWMGEEDRRVMICNAFPGEHRAAPLKPAALAAPAPSKKMRAPEGVTNFSHGGVHHEIGKDGTITVPADVADTLVTFGFMAVA